MYVYGMGRSCLTLECNLSRSASQTSFVTLAVVIYKIVNVSFQSNRVLMCFRKKINIRIEAQNNLHIDYINILLPQEG